MRRRISRIGTVVYGALLSATVLSSLGCFQHSAPSVKRHALHGQVNFNGSPIANGEILFSPDGASENSGPGTLARIRDGTFLIDQHQGVVGGPYLLEIIAFRVVDANVLDPTGESPPPRTLFPRYQMRANLPQGGKFDINVPASAAINP